MFVPSVGMQPDSCTLRGGCDVRRGTGLQGPETSKLGLPAYAAAKFKPPSGRAWAMPSKTSVFLNVLDIERSIKFYEGLGFKTVKRYPSRDGKATWYADLELDGAELSLGHIPANSEKTFRDWVATPLGAGVVVYFSVPDVEKHHRLAKEIGAVIEVPLEKRSYGTAFTVNNPDGYTVTFLTE